MTTLTFPAGQQASAGDVFHIVGRAVSAMALGMRASREWQRLSTMSDAALAHEGLSREQIGRAVFERHFR